MTTGDGTYTLAGGVGFLILNPVEICHAKVSCFSTACLGARRGDGARIGHVRRLIDERERDHDGDAEFLELHREIQPA